MLNTFTAHIEHLVKVDVIKFLRIIYKTLKCHKDKL